MQLASAFGYRVVGVDIGADRLQFVRSLGADLALDAGEALETVQRDLGGVHAVLVFSAKIAGLELGLQLLRRGGVFVAVGLPPTSDGNLQLNPFQFFFMDWTLLYAVSTDLAG